MNPPGVRSVRRRFNLDRPLVRFAFVGPAVVFLVVMFGYPLYYNVAMSLQQFTVASFLTGVAPFVGFANYTDRFGDPLFLAALGKTAVFTVFSIAGQMTIGMLLAPFFRTRFRESTFHV